MKRQLLLLAALFTLLTGAAQGTQELITGNGNKVKQQKAITAYQSLRISGPFEVILISDEHNNMLSLEGSENIVSLLEVKNINDTLYIGLPKGLSFRAHKNNKVKIKVPYYTSLNNIYLKGSGTVNSKAALKSNVKIQLEGSGHIDLRLFNAGSEAYVLGSGNITLKGAVQDFKCKVIGSGNIEAERLECTNVDIDLSGSGNADIVCNKTIKGKISGSGNVVITGHPKEQDLKRQGTGEFRAAL
ncbi:head GIN domain-containing protein [Flavobacterium sp. ST-75]|uniref:Head GIN domain-containing protein n=1 Tax=Flavobacterium rhizophilum TaxID=3163296 RepID=A0ABW8YF82_9FLAO